MNVQASLRQSTTLIVIAFLLALLNACGSPPPTIPGVPNETTQAVAEKIGDGMPISVGDTLKVVSTNFSATFRVSLVDGLITPAPIQPATWPSNVGIRFSGSDSVTDTFRFSLIIDHSFKQENLAVFILKSTTNGDAINVQALDGVTLEKVN